MDCCENSKTNMKKTKMKDENNGESMKGGNKIVEIKKSTLIWVVIGVLVIATIFLTFKASSIGTGAAQATASAAKTVASTASSGMVGGC